MTNGSRIRGIAGDMLPGIMVFALLTLDPPPAGVAPWILRAYSPLLLWALLQKLDRDCRILGVRFRSGRIPPGRWRDATMQSALLAMTIAFAWAPSA